MSVHLPLAVLPKGWRNLCGEVISRGGSLSMQVTTFYTLSIAWSLLGKIVASRRQEEEEVITTKGMAPGHGQGDPGLTHTGPG